MKWEGEEESSNVEDRRGLSKKGLALGGGAAVVVVIIATLLGVDPQKIAQLVGGAGQAAPGAGQAQERPLDAQEQRSHKFAATILRFTEKVWDEQFRRIGQEYKKPHMVLFTQQVDTGCGTAPSAVGPFYCPADQTVYLDPTFFDELQDRLAGSKAEFSQAYVIAHEVGHHVQNLLGYSSRAHQKERAAASKGEANQWSVRLELQADYLAGVWAYHGQEQFRFIEPGDVESAIKSANAIGDDRLQKRATGFVSPEKFTHGTSAQRVKWFRAGLETGDLRRMQELFDLPYDQL
jgi:predicted metalloprotease